MAWALLVKRKFCLAHLARALTFESLAQSKVNSLFRFLGKEKVIFADDFFVEMGLWVISFFAKRDKLVLDTNFVKDWMIFSLILQMAVCSSKDLLFC